MPKGAKFGGRKAGTPNKATRELKDLARSYLPECIKELARLAKRADSETARVAAIKEVFDRAVGKAPQAIEHSGSIGTYDLTKVSDTEIDQLENILRSASVTGGGDSGEAETRH